MTSIRTLSAPASTSSGSTRAASAPARRSAAASRPRFPPSRSGASRSRAFAAAPWPTSAAAAAPTTASCSTTSRPRTSPATSTVLRAAVGDAKLTFAGHSYGSHLAATYANLFPQRVRALVLDGVLESATRMNGIGPFSLRGRQPGSVEPCAALLPRHLQAGRAALRLLRRRSRQGVRRADGAAPPRADRAVHLRRRGQHHARRARVHAGLEVHRRGAGRRPRRRDPARRRGG